MLKIKDGENLEKIREKYNFILEDGFFMCPSIDELGKIRINCFDSYYSKEINEKLDDLYDLIQSGLVEKIEE